MSGTFWDQGRKSIIFAEMATMDSNHGKSVFEKEKHVSRENNQSIGVREDLKMIIFLRLEKKQLLSL